jgi:hypothetical protein
VKEKKNLTHDRTTAKALKQQKGNKGGKDPGTARHERILLQPIHSRTRFNPSESKWASTSSPPPPPLPPLHGSLSGGSGSLFFLSQQNTH